MTRTLAHRLKDPTGVLALAAAAGVALYLLAALPLSAVTLAAVLLAAIGATVAVCAPELDTAPGLGAANRATLTRAAIVAGLAGLLPHPAFVAEHALWVAAAAALALALDAIDGWLARRKQEATTFGARFDMELDAAFLVVLCALVWSLDKTGAWIMLIGAMRYAFVAAGWLMPTLQRPLPPSWRRKAICGVQGIALVVCLVPLVQSTLAVPVAATALAALTASFAMDVHWLLRHSAHSTIGETQP